MTFLWGKMLWGEVDRDASNRFVTTQFFHLWFLPVVPLCGVLVEESTEEGKPHQGTQIPLDTKSVVVGYLRGWSAMTSIVATIFILAGIMHYLRISQDDWRSAPQALGSVAILLGTNLYLLFAESRWYLVALAMWFGFCFCWWKWVVGDAANLPENVRLWVLRTGPAVPISAVALLVYSLTRVYTHKRVPQAAR